MISILIYDHPWIFWVLGILFLSWILSIHFNKDKYANKLMVVLIIFIFGIGIYLRSFSTHLESPSENQPIYILRYNLFPSDNRAFTNFSSKLLSFHQEMKGDKSTLTLKLINDQYCLLINWTMPNEKLEQVISSNFGQKLIIPKEPQSELCPDILTKISFNEKDFNHTFERLSPTSARHLYRLRNQ